jgi:hypothetical protein
MSPFVSFVSDPCVRFYIHEGLYEHVEKHFQVGKRYPTPTDVTDKSHPDTAVGAGSNSLVRISVLAG